MKNNVFERHWKDASAIVAFAVSTFFLFAFLPKFVGYDSNKIIEFSKFLCAGIFFITAAALRILRIKKQNKYHLIILILTFFLAICMLFKFWKDLDTYSIYYTDIDARVVIGSNNQIKKSALTQMDKVKIDRGRELRIEEHIQSNAYNSGDFWDRQILDENFYTLSIEFLLTITLFFVFMISVNESIKLNN